METNNNKTRKLEQNIENILNKEKKKDCQTNFINKLGSYVFFIENNQGLHMCCPLTLIAVLDILTPRNLETRTRLGMNTESWLQ